MNKILLVVMVLSNNGSVVADVTEHETACPPMKSVFMIYEPQKAANKIQDWAASCVHIKFETKPKVEI